MRRYLLDTGIAADYVYDRLDMPIHVRQVTARGNRVGIGIPVLCELFASVEASKSRAKNYPRLMRASRTLFIWPLDRAAAEEYGRLFALLRRRGRPIPQIDIQIAAIALTLGRCTVASKDSDFLAVPALDVENWAVSPPVP